MPFNVTQRQVIVFSAGIALGLAGAWALFGRAGEAPAAGAPKAATAATARAAPATVAVVPGACAFTPVATTAASDDGRVQLQPDLTGSSARDVDAWILDGKEAVAAGRQKDAESDFLMACRAAEKLREGGALPQAEAMYHLGRHYAGLAGAAGGSRSAELWRRAESLFAASLQTYSARYGEASDKTRFAAKGLAEAREHTGGGVPVEAKVTKATPPAPVKVEAPKEAAKVPAPAVKEPPAAVAVAKPPAARPVAPEPVVTATPPAARTPPVATRAPEPQVAVVKPVPPKPRPAPAAPAHEAQDRVVVEPPARAGGSATGLPADTPIDNAQ